MVKAEKENNPCRDVARRSIGGISNGVRATLLSAVLALVAPPAFAAFTQDLVVPPGGFISSLSGWASGGNPTPGDDPADVFNFSPHSVEDTFSNGTTASAASMFPPAGGAMFSETAANGTARLGSVSFAGRSEQTFDASNEGSIHSVVHGGWVDTVTITSSAVPNGTQAIWLFEVDITVAFDVEGWNGDGITEIHPYVNQMSLPNTTPGFDDGAFSSPISTTLQHAERQLASLGNSTQLSIGISDTVTFAAEITLGTPFELGIFTLGWAVAGTNSAFPTIGAIGEFDSTVTWGGDAGLSVLGGGAIGSYDITSLSGTDWVVPIPVPGVAWLMAIGTAGLLGYRRRAVLR